MSFSAFFAIPGDLQTLTGGYGYDRRILVAALNTNRRLQYLELVDGFPVPTDVDVKRVLRSLHDLPSGCVALVDGLAFGALPAAGLAAIRHPLVALVHHPLGLETGLDAETRDALIASERAALAVARAIIVTSDTTRDTLVSAFDVPDEKITIAAPGVDAAARATGSGSSTLELLAVGAIIPRKGYDVLIAALGRLRHLDWRLRIVGDATRSPSTTRDLRAAIGGLSLGDRVELAGEMAHERLGDAYAATDIFVMSSRYEGYGMVLGEAMAHGLCIVTTTGGAAARTTPEGAALKVAPGDVEGLAAALERAMTDAGLRSRLADASWRAGQALPRWSDTAEIIFKTLERVS